MARSIRRLSASLVLGLVSLLATSASAQVHFEDCASVTGGNANIVIPLSIEPTVDGAALAAGDEIAVFTPEGLCAGTATWTGGSISVAAWLDDLITPEVDGFIPGDSITYRVWDASAGEELAFVSVEYASDQPFYRTDGKYGANSIYALSTFSATRDEPYHPAEYHASTLEDSEVEIEVAIDLDGEFSVEIPRLPSHGAATVEENHIIYVPELDFHGRDTLMYSVRNTIGDSASAVVIIDVAAVDDAPYFPEDDALNFPENGAEIVLVDPSTGELGSPDSYFTIDWSEAVDVDGDPIEYLWELSASEEFSETVLSMSAGEKRKLKVGFDVLAALWTNDDVEDEPSRTFYHRVTAAAAEQSVVSDARIVTFVRSTSSGSGDPEHPTRFSLDQNYPNPFNPQTTISYTLDETAFVRLTVYDVIGKEIATLVSEEKPSGDHRLTFEAGRLNSGVYVYRIEAGDHTAMKRMVLLK